MVYGRFDNDGNPIEISFDVEYINLSGYDDWLEITIDFDPQYQEVYISGGQQLVRELVIDEQEDDPIVECCSYVPVVINPKTIKYPIDKNISREIVGAFFTPEMTIECSGLTNISYQFIDDNNIVISGKTISTLGFYDLTISNGSTYVYTDFIEVAIINWIDLRNGGDTVSPRARNQGNIVRDANGLGISGQTGWDEWVVFEEYEWERTIKNTYSVVVDVGGAFMVGLMAEGWNETSTAQYSQQQVSCYFNSDTNLWGLYQASNTQNLNVNISGVNLVKCVFTFNGRQSEGGQFSAYNVSSGDWDDNSLPLIENVNINADNGGTPIFPCLVPNTGTVRMQAFLIEAS